MSDNLIDDETYDYTNEEPLDEDDYENEDYYEHEESDEVACD